EIELYRKWLGNQHPFISENGGGIFIPRGYFESTIKGEIRDNYIIINLGTLYEDIRKVFIDIREGLRIKVKGFGDMTVKEVANFAGLSIIEADLAKKRDFDEPFIFEEGELRVGEFLYAIEESGLNWTQGRFFHILGDNNKGKAVKILKYLYEKAYGKIKTIGLGDGLNDLPLLQEVDYPVLVRKEDGSYEARIDLPNIIKIDGIGPEGWANAVMGLI
ncbi:MAG TPA: hypothetical protein VI387_08075, partial [Candidatus Brocadiales bacterium]|nr:hypothetical protein [Candidatus Brocadiales bacterium]